MPQLYVSPEQFGRQMWWLQRLGLVGVTLTEGVRRLEQGNAAGCVAITFDDGYADNVSNAAPILAQYRFKATCFVVSGKIGAYNAWDAEALAVRKPLMSESDMVAWVDAGLEIGSHTDGHRDLTALPREEVMQEVVDSRAVLQRLTGAVISTFCYPWGRHNADVAWCVGRAGYRFGVTTRRGRAHRDDDPLRLPRVSINGGKSLVNFVLKASTGYCDWTRR
jgi:peptidoglycan/xylan/chitin deacetylase (PgdA/CDA1 family)